MGAAAKPTEYVTREDLSSELAELEDRMSKRIIDDISLQVQILGQQVNDELTEIRRELSDIRKSLNNLQNTMDGFLKRLEIVEDEQVVDTAQYKRLLAWAEKVSAKTGIPLEY